MRRFKTSVLITVFSVLTLVVLGLYFAIQKRLPTAAAILRLPQQAANLVKTGITTSDSPSQNQNDSPTAVNGVAAAQPKEPSQFAKWLKTESQSLNKTGINMAQKEIEMRNLAQGFSSGQKDELVDSALNTQISANERILATYLLSLSSGQGAETQLLAVAEAPLPDFGSTAPHTEGEIRRVQELSLRYIMVDELAKRALKNTQARAQLENIITTAAAAEVRSYARRKLSEIDSL